MFHYKNNLTPIYLAILLTPGIPLAEELESVTVTANRIAQTADETLASVSVITRKDIEAAQSADIVDLLRAQAGIDVARTGGPGQGTSVFLRGTNSDSTLILVDGVRASSATTGSFAWQSMSTSEIERIEIVRGPRAVQYGSDAIGGVIQIFTRKNRSLNLYVQAGSYNSQTIEAGYGGGDKVKYSVNFSGRNTDGFSATNNKNSAFDPDDDGFKNRSLSANLAWEISKKSELKFTGWRSHSTSQYDAADFNTFPATPVSGSTKSDNATLDIRFTNQTHPNWKQTFSIGSAIDNVEDTSANSSLIKSKRKMADWQNDITLGLNHLLTLGLSAVEENADNKDLIAQTTTFDEKTNNKAVFGLWQSSIGMNNFNVSGRVDNYKNFGTHTTGQVAWGIKPSKTTRINASLGNAFKAPSLNQLYHPGFGGFFAGNQDLNPESSITFEAGAHYTTPDKKQNIGVNAYRTKIDNLIAYSGGATFNAENINEARIDGLEVVYGLRSGSWIFNTNFTLQKAINDITKSDLLRRARQKFNFELRHFFGKKGDLGILWNYVGARDDFSSNVLAPYSLVNLTGSYLVTKELRLEARIENLLNEDYETAYSYNTSKRAIYAGIRYNLGQ